MQIHMHYYVSLNDESLRMLLYKNAIRVIEVFANHYQPVQSTYSAPGF